MGVGIHGEPGRRRVQAAVGRRHRRRDGAAPSSATSAPSAGSEALLLVNGFGGTPPMELYLMYNAAKRVLEARA